MQILEANMVEAWFEKHCKGRAGICFAHVEETIPELGNDTWNSVEYFNSIFEDNGLSRFDFKDLSEYVFIEVEADIMRKMINAVHDYDKFGPDLYGWDGQHFFWSRD